MAFSNVSTAYSSHVTECRPGSASVPWPGFASVPRPAFASVPWPCFVIKTSVFLKVGHSFDEEADDEQTDSGDVASVAEFRRSIGDRVVRRVDEHHRQTDDEHPSCLQFENAVTTVTQGLIDEDRDKDHQFLRIIVELY
ncbi:unnamed protein product [Nesidiocoris tenuis]|uniref:Uncharacterized protein n=1 Tax=Nesidiocoris tenuis TaxID=355587 RepID=A0A6H5GHT2_9HEMI|nr:unnamed protein product [Nesidiocoris tenuis]CAB0003280.1 unnamed protein product [Nesidiocoris tenuis]